MSAARVRARAGSRAAAVFRVEGDAVVHPDGSRSAMFRTAQLDVESLDVARRGVVLAAFARLCNTLDAPLQLLVRVRPLTPPDASAARIAAPSVMEHAMREHWREHAAASAVHRRDVLIAVRASSDAALRQAAARVLDAARAMGVDAQRMATAQALEAVHGVQDSTVESAWREAPQHVRMGDVYARSYALRRFPGHAVTAGWLSTLLKVAVECDIAIHLTPAQLADALHSLGTRLRDFTAHRMLEAERGVVSDVHVDVAMDSAHQLRNRLARNVSRPLRVSVTATVRAGSLTELQRRGEVVRDAFHATLATVEATHFRHLRAYLTTLPLAWDALGEHKLVELHAAATCVPWVEAGCSDDDGYRLGAALDTGVPVTLSPFDTRQHANANIAVLAASGHGKSFVLGSIVLEAAAHGVDSVIIDPEGEYRGLVAALDGSLSRARPGNRRLGERLRRRRGRARRGDRRRHRPGHRDVRRVARRRGTSPRRCRGPRRAGPCGRSRRVALLSDCLPLLEAEARDIACGGAQVLHGRAGRALQPADVTAARPPGVRHLPARRS